jgi:GT2 family glycosyltransferase
MPIVSVVLLNWNGAHLLPTCLDSLRAQTFRDFEITMPDNGSTDGSLELVARHYPEVKVIRFPRNMGFCIAMNAGMRASQGQFVFALNNDTQLYPDCLEQLVAAMSADPGLGICAPKMLYYDDPRLINSAGHACAEDMVVVDIGRGEPDGEWFSRPREVLGGCAGAVLYRKAMLDQIGLFDPDFFISYEDIDLGWRAQWAGWRAQYVPTAVVLHREGVTRQIRGRRSLFLAARNIVHVWTKNWPLSSLLRHLPAVWRGWTRRARGLVESGYPDALPALVGSLLLQTPRMLARRRQIQHTRVVPLSHFEEMVSQGIRQTAHPPED